jgi:NADH pyrophosphatase NudC (nudix superfamily)
MADVFAGNVMDLCCYCGKEFEKKAKGYQRVNIVVRNTIFRKAPPSVVSGHVT